MGNGVIWEMATRCTCLYNGKAQKKNVYFQSTLKFYRQP